MNRRNVFVTRIFSDAGKKILDDAGVAWTEWTEKRELTPQELIDRCRDFDALYSIGPNRIDEAFLAASAHLKVVALNAVGYDNVDVAAATRLGIPIGYTPNVLNKATADTAFLLMQAVSRKAMYVYEKILRGEWKFFQPMEDLGTGLDGKTLGVWGLGRIGCEMARRCLRAFDMKIIYHNRGANPEAERDLGARRVSFEELLASSDVLSVHTALTPETRGKMNYGAFAQMKPTAIFINTARGAIHDETDLVRALEEKLIWGAGLDVTNPEPMASGNPLLRMPTVAVLPHIGSATKETRDAMASIACRNVVAALSGERLPECVNPEVYQASSL